MVCFQKVLIMINEWGFEAVFSFSAEATDGGLRNILKFATGAAAIPVLGFEEKGCLRFRHPSDEPGDHSIEFPRANSCTNVMALPIHNDYATFKSRMDAAIGHLIFTME